jgi:hypothetical protein
LGAFLFCRGAGQGSGPTGRSLQHRDRRPTAQHQDLGSDHELPGERNRSVQQDIHVVRETHAEQAEETSRREGRRRREPLLRDQVHPDEEDERAQEEEDEKVRGGGRGTHSGEVDQRDQDGTYV